MNAYLHLTTVAGISAVMALQSQAIEAPVDDAPPPMLNGQVSPQATENGRTAFIGIVAEEIPAALSAHLGIQPGDGIVVKAVMPKGPAAIAGIKSHDVITQLDGTPLRQADDLSRIVRSKGPGETLNADVVQNGKATVIHITLGSRPNHMADHAGEPLDQLNLNGVPNDVAQRMRNMIEGNLLHFESPFPHSRLGINPYADDVFEQMRERMQQHLQQGDRQRPPSQAEDHFQLQQSTTVKVLDQEGSIEIASVNGSRTLTARDTSNQVVWSGPWNTDEDKATAPEGLCSRAERLNLESSFDDSGFKLKPIR